MYGLPPGAKLLTPDDPDYYGAGYKGAEVLQPEDRPWLPSDLLAEQPSPLDVVDRPLTSPYEQVSEQEFFGLDRVLAQQRATRQELESQRDLLTQDEAEREGRGFFTNLGRGVDQSGAMLQRQLGGLSALTGFDSEADFHLSDARRRMTQYEDDSSVVQDLSAQMISSAVPSIAGGFAGAAVGLPMVGATVAAGLQSAASVQADAEDGYIAQGLSPSDARYYARFPALLSGAITAALTRYVPGAGETMLPRLFTGGVPRGTLQQVVREAVKEVAKEVPEEVVDQLAQGIIARGSYDPDKPLSEIVRQAWDAGGLAILTSGTTAVPGVGLAAARAGLDSAAVAFDQRARPGESLMTADEAARAALDPRQAQASTAGRVAIPPAVRPSQRASMRREREPISAAMPIEGGDSPEIQTQEGRQERVTPAAGVVNPAPAVSFQTSKGSVYSVNSQSTTRNKSLHPEHGADDIRLKPASQITVYVNPKEADDFGSQFQAQGDDKTRILVDQNAGTIQTITEKPDGTRGQWRNSIYKYQTQPAVGLTPVEVWNDGRTAHFGNVITSVTPAPATSPQVVGGRQYTPAVQMDDGTVVTGEMAGTANTHDAISSILPDGVRRRGFVGPDGQFMTIMQVARAEAARQAAEPQVAPASPIEPPPTPAIAPEAIVALSQRLAQETGAQVALSPSPAGGIEVSNLRVPDEQQSQGIGTSVLTEIKAAADQAGVSVTLTAVPDTRESARLNAFYERNGFVQTGTDAVTGNPNYAYTPKKKNTDYMLAQKYNEDAPDVPVTDDVLYHGTNRQFARFETGVDDRRSQKKVNRFYFSSSPSAPINVALSGRGAMQVDLDRYADEGDFGGDYHNRIEAAIPELGEDLKESLKAGRKIVMMEEDGSYSEIKTESKIDQLVGDKNYDALNSIMVFKKSRAPRVLKAIIKGKTLDLLDVSKAPKSLLSAMKSEGIDVAGYKGWNIYELFERSESLIEWAKKNGFNKIRFPENRETADEQGAAVIVLPEAIGDFTDIGIEKQTEAMPGTPPAREKPYAREARGGRDIRALIETNTDLDPQSKTAYLAMASSPLLKGADFSGLTLRFTNQLPAAALADSDPQQMMVRIRDGINRPDALGHEVFHIVHDLLPADLKAEVEKARQASIARVLAGKVIPPEISAGGVSSAEFEALADRYGIPADERQVVYNHRSASEFMASVFGDRQARESIPKSVMARIADYVKGVIDAIRKAFSDNGEQVPTPVLDDLYRRIMAGEVALNAPPATRGVINGSRMLAWAERTIAESKGRIGAGLDPELLAAYAVKGAALIESGVLAAGDWTAAMIAEFSDAIAPHLPAIRARSEEIMTMTPEERESARNYDGNPFVFSATPEDAENHAKLAPARKQQAVADAQMAQAVDITDTLTKAGAFNDPAVTAALGASNWRGIAAVGEGQSTLGRQGYREVMARTPNVYDKWRIARAATAQMNTFSDGLETAREDGKAAREEMEKPSFIERRERLTRALNSRDIARANHESVNSILQSAAVEAERSLKESARDDIKASQLRGVLRGIRAVQESSEASRQLLEDMASVLSATPDGFNALYGEVNPSAAKIRDIYLDLLKSTDRTRRVESRQQFKDQSPIVSYERALPDPNLLKWVSFTLAKSKSVRDNLHALILSRDSTVAAGLAPFQARLAADFKRDPSGTLKRLIRNEGKLVSQQERSEFLWRALNREYTADLEALQTRADAGDIAAKILDDPEFRALRAEIAKDAGQVGRRAPYKFGDATYVLPDGTEVNLDPGYMVGSETWITGQREEIVGALDRLKAWLTDSANFENPNYTIFERDHELIESTFIGMEQLVPSSSNTLFRTGMSMLGNVPRQVGGRMSFIGAKVIQTFDRLDSTGKEWSKNTTAALDASRVAAMKSHGYEWGVFGNDVIDANERWLRAGGNELIASYDGTGTGYKVGHQISPDFTVTQADVDHVRAQAAWARDLFARVNKIQKTLTEDNLVKGSVAFRAPRSTGPNMTPRVFEDRIVKAFGPRVEGRAESTFKAAYKRYLDDPDKGAPEIVAFLNQNWHLVGNSLIKDRDSQFARATMFDGESGALAKAAKAVSENSGVIANFGDLVQFLANADTAATAEEAQRIMLEEYGQIINQFLAQVEDGDPAAQKIASKEADSAFNKSRNMKFAPYAFYRNGFHTKQDVERLASASWADGQGNVVTYLEAAYRDLIRQRNEFERRVETLQAQGAANAEGNARDAAAIALQAGKNFDEYSGLKSKISMVAAMLSHMRGTDFVAESTDAEALWDRTMNTIVASLVTTIKATSYNYLTGPIWIGRTLKSYGTGTTKAAAIAGFDLFFNTILYRQLPSILLSAAKLPVLGGIGAVKGIGHGLAGLPSGLRQPSTLYSKTFAPFWRSTLTPILQELGGSMLTRVAETDRLIKAGLIGNPDKTAQFEAQMMVGSLNKGITAKKLGHMSKLGRVPAAMLETMWLPLSGAAFPTVADTAINTAMSLSMTRLLDALERKLKIAYMDIKDGKYRAYDFNAPGSITNRLSAKELGMTDGELAAARQEFAQSGVSFDDEAGKFLRAIHLEVDGQQLSGKRWWKPGRELKAKFIAQALRDQVIGVAINQANRGSASNAAMALQKRTLATRFAKPLLPWRLRMLGQMLNAFSVPRTTGEVMTSSQIARSKIVAGVIQASLFMLAVAIGAGWNIGSEEAMRKLRLLLYRQVAGNRQPWEYETPWRQALAFADAGLQSVPILGYLSNAMDDALPGRAANEPTLVVLETIKAFGRYFEGLLKTGDATYGLPQMVTRILPDTAIVMNRLESQEGKRERVNAVNIIKRAGPEELVKKALRGASANVTELSPYIPRMENAAYMGNQAEFMAAYNEAVAKATELGKPDPQRLVNQMWQARNPYNAALTTRMTPAQRDIMLAKLNDQDRQTVAGAERNFAMADAWLGLNEPTFAREPRDTSSSTSTGSASGAAPASGLSIPRPRSVVSRVGRSTLSSAAGPAGLGKPRASRRKAGRVTRVGRAKNSRRKLSRSRGRRKVRRVRVRR